MERSKEQIETIGEAVWRHRDEGLSWRQISAKIEVSVTTLRRYAQLYEPKATATTAPVTAELPQLEELDEKIVTILTHLIRRETVPLGVRDVRLRSYGYPRLAKRLRLMMSQEGVAIDDAEDYARRFVVKERGLDTPTA